MIELKKRSDSDSYYLAVAEIEAVLEREGNTSEIVTKSGRRYTSIFSKEKVTELINNFIFNSARSGA